MRPAVFIDRDGTINEEHGYINHINRFVLLPGVAKAISLLNKHNYIVVVTSNQSGVARGYFPITLVKEIHEFMKQELAKQNAYVDGIYFCPHHPNGVVPEYSRECECRKPNVGLIKKAEVALDIDMETSYIIGDRLLDIKLARNVNVPGILVLTGYGKGELKYSMSLTRITPAYVAEDLLQAVQWILKSDK
jgi:D-glycero-D-manno-heptose 1,7-bisphosphate phosphatase